MRQSWARKPFYVGKGQGFRIDEHERDHENNVEKAAVITALKEAGRFGKRIIGRYESEAEAFAVEATLIKWVYGIASLTNRVLRLKIQLTGRDVAPAFTAKSARQNDRETIQAFAEQFGQVVKNGTPPYVGLWQIEGQPPRGINPARPSLDDEEQIELCIERMVALLRSYISSVRL